MTSFLRFVAVLAIGVSHVHPALSQQSPCAKWHGVWEYTIAGQSGMFIITSDYAIGMYTAAQRARLGEQPTIQERANAFDNVFAEAWKIRCEGSRIHFEVLHSAYPNRVGATFVSEVTLTGNDASWKLIAPDGTQTGAGSGRRIQR